ncbi:hypothetical protein C8Q78DRAFT_1078617 [Trametes maxima]|nr:hypothetical protein C8Q78DRAFT_1078617 [Trametes maxima]
MSSNENNFPHSLPIPIGSRRRSGSVSDGSSTDSGSVSPASPVQTPASGTVTLPRIAPITPSTSPILSYFLSQSPISKSPPSTFHFRRGMAPPVYEDDEPQIPAQKPVNGSAQAPRSTTPPGMKSVGADAAPARKARRANTMAPGTPRPRRAPSPMGERILKGHFDGFN